MNKFFIIIFMTLFLTTSVLAYNGFGGGGWYYSSPMDFLESPWIVFLLVFAVFFALIFFSLAKTFKGNTAVPITISVVISFLIAAMFSEKFYIRQYLGDWIFLIAILIAIFAVMKILLGHLGISVLFAAITGVLIFLKTYIDPYIDFPYNIISSPLFRIYEFFVSWHIIWIAGILTVILAYLQVRGAAKGFVARGKEWRENKEKAGGLLNVLGRR